MAKKTVAKKKSRSFDERFADMKKQAEKRTEKATLRQAIADAKAKLKRL